MSWPAVKLGDVLRRSEETIALQPDATYREITVKLWGKGVVLRGTLTGAEISSPRRFLARAGQLIVSRIDARNGAIGIVPSDLEGAVVTNDFPLFIADSRHVEPTFLGWLSRTQGFVDLCIRASEGTTNRVRLQETRFLALEARLPPVNEQRLIAARIEKLVAQINDARRLSAEASDELELLWRSTVDVAFRGRLLKTVAGSCARSALEAVAVTISDGQDRSHNNAHPGHLSVGDDGPCKLPPDWVWTTLGSIVTHLVDCVNDTPDFANEDTGFLGLKSTNVRPYHLDLSRRWHVSEGDFLRWNRREPPRAGDILGSNQRSTQLRAHS